MKIKDFIEKAIVGDWKPSPEFDVVARNSSVKVYKNDPDDTKVLMGYHEILLDPEAWKAVGKVEGWKDEVCEDCGKRTKSCECQLSGRGAGREPEWKFWMHRMIDALAEGKSVEEYLETL